MFICKDTDKSDPHVSTYTRNGLACVIDKFRPDLAPVMESEIMITPNVGTLSTGKERWYEVNVVGHPGVVAYIVGEVERPHRDVREIDNLMSESLRKLKRI